MTIRAKGGNVVITLSVQEAELSEINIGCGHLALALDDPLMDWQAFGAAVADAKAQLQIQKERSA